MSPAASARRRDDSSGDDPLSSGKGLSIGEVLVRLRPEFPDVTISKIRFLEAEGLIEPRRSPSGYRKFAAPDVERLRLVLTAQRDHYLPLRVIKDHLEAWDRGEESAVRRLMTVPEMVADSDGFIGADLLARSPGDGVRLSRADVLQHAGIDDELLEQLESYGLVTARFGNDQFDGEAVAIAKVAGELAASGLEPRHLRATRTAAEREVGLIDQLVTPVRRHPGAEAQARADETARELSAALLRLHALLVRVGLS